MTELVTAPGSTLLAVNVGRPQPLPHGKTTVLSGIVKHGVSHAVTVGADGLPGDEQADLVNHGGPDKAVCVYAAEHYPRWEARLGRSLPPAAFGENFTVRALLEREVCIGDVFQVGGAVVQVSQPRGPCFKIGALHARPQLTAWVRETGLTGFYFRVLQSGQVQAGDAITLLRREGRGHSVASVNTVSHQRQVDRESILQLLDDPTLAEPWKELLGSRLSPQR